MILNSAKLQYSGTPIFRQEVKVDIEELVINERIRGDCYKLLSACFYYPGKEVFIQEGLLKNLTEALKRVCPHAAVFLEKMEEAISHYTDEELLVDYSKLFVGPYELKAPPYGSVYLDKEKKVMGDSTMEVIETYSEAGLSINDDFKELPDHIAVELEFMYYLIFKETEALEKSEMDAALHFIGMQRAFLDRFLGRWVGQFCEKIKEGTDNNFYLALADCVSAFIMNSAIPNGIYKHLNEKTQGVLD